MWLFQIQGQGDRFLLLMGGAEKYYGHFFKIPKKKIFFEPCGNAEFGRKDALGRSVITKERQRAECQKQILGDIPH